MCTFYRCEANLKREVIHVTQLVTSEVGFEPKACTLSVVSGALEGRDLDQAHGSHMPRLFLLAYSPTRPMI